MRAMHPAAWRVRQYETHRALTSKAARPHAGQADLQLDAIIVPASRPAANLDQAITLARAADCWLLIVCSQLLPGSAAKDFLAARSYDKAIVVDLPPGYSHPLLDFPGLQAVQRDLPEACGFFTTDLSMKRNVGLIMARMLQWRRVFFLDDDIRDIALPDLQETVNLLRSYPVAGLWVTKFPDNSIACHANRMTDMAQDVFVSGAALAVDCTADIGFFPDVYNEDWLFFFDHAATRRLANSGLQITQMRYDPFADPRRAAWQEFGDVLAEGLYALLHLGLGIQDATTVYWAHFLEARRTFLEAIISRSESAPAEIRDELKESVQWSIKSLLCIKPDLCERYVQQWRNDLVTWKWRAAKILLVSSVDEALRVLGLEAARATGGRAPIPSFGSGEKRGFTPGAVSVPWFATMENLPEGAAGLRRSYPESSAAAADTEEGATRPFSKVTVGVSSGSRAVTNSGADRLMDQASGGQVAPRRDGKIGRLVRSWSPRDSQLSWRQRTSKTGPVSR